jgi:hypothetical protein
LRNVKFAPEKKSPQTGPVFGKKVTSIRILSQPEDFLERLPYHPVGDLIGIRTIEIFLNLKSKIFNLVFPDIRKRIDEASDLKNTVPFCVTIHVLSLLPPNGNVLHAIILSTNRTRT